MHNTTLNFRNYLKPHTILHYWMATMIVTANQLPKDQNLLFFTIPAIILSIFLWIWVGKQNKVSKTSNRAPITYGIVSLLTIALVVVYSVIFQFK